MTRSYSPADWIADAGWLVERQNAQDDTFNRTAVIAYFERKYGPAAELHLNRLFAALRYFLKHAEAFNEGSFAISCKQGSLIGQPLLLALLVVFSGDETEATASAWPTHEVKALALKIQGSR